MRKNNFFFKIFVISGPSGSGKTTLLEKTFQDRCIREHFLKAITATTRLPRGREKDKQDYYFFSREAFLRKVKQGYFLETKKVFDNFYGSPRKFLSVARRQKKHLVLCLDVQGALDVRRRYPEESVLIFIFAPSRGALEKRLVGRTSEDITALKKRLRLAEKEVEYATKYDFWVINDLLPKATEELKGILQAEGLRRIHGA